MNQSNLLERQAALLEVQGSQALVVHSSMFMQLMAARHSGDEKLAAFYTARFAPDVKHAYEAWLAQSPFENPLAAPHPFVPELYQLRSAPEIARARAESGRLVAEARLAGGLSGQYLANTVLLASVLLFAGTAKGFEHRRVRQLSSMFGVGLFVFAAIRMLLMPAA